MLVTVPCQPHRALMKIYVALTLTHMSAYDKYSKSLQLKNLHKACWSVMNELALIQQLDNSCADNNPCNDLKENPLCFNNETQQLPNTQLKINWISSCSAPQKSDASTHTYKSDPVQVTPSSEKSYV